MLKSRLFDEPAELEGFFLFYKIRVSEYAWI